MIYNRNRRATLRRYANEALDVLRRPHSRDSKMSDFGNRLRNSWNRRADLFYDGRDKIRPYIDHLYTLDHPAPYTRDNPRYFNRRELENFSDRTPSASRNQVNEILNIYSAGPSGRDLRFRSHDVYFWYDFFGMISEQYYFEHHLSLFYRILFFFLELRAYGIWTDEDDIYEGPIPFDVVPEEIQAILYNDTIFRDYLIDLEDNEMLSVDSENTPARVESLLMSLLSWVDRMRPSTSVTTNSTTTKGVDSTTAKYEDSIKGKGNFCRLNSGKCIPKRQFSDRSTKGSDEQSSKEGSKKFKDSQQRNDQYYKYGLSNGDVNQLLFPEEEKSTAMKILSGISSFIGGSRIHDELKRRR